MIIVTGAAGFIGSNTIKALNDAGHTDILAVDDLTDGKKYINIASYTIADYMDYKNFLQHIHSGELPENIEAIIHLGACSTTTEWDGRYIMRVNYDYSKAVLHYCIKNKTPLVYASSAAVYGGSTEFLESAKKQLPLNVYGYSKWLFDQYMLKLLPTIKSQVVGLRYFNVYGPHEQHKGSMASVAFHLMNQLNTNGAVKLFEGCDGYEDGAQLRDFIFVEDVANINVWLTKNPQVSGIFNIGTGKAREFNDIAKTLIDLNGSGQLEYIPFPDHLKGAYQSYTQADISKLREAGYTQEFHTLEAGLKKYFDYRQAQRKLNIPALQ